MEQYQTQLNGIFQALADPTRRAVLGRLGRGPASISDLEDSGLIRSRKEGRVRTCVIETQRFAAIEAWLSEQRALWEGRTDRLEKFVTTPPNKEISK
jgi:DNA-binding transcriptional ArsR family regulator